MEAVNPTNREPRRWTHLWKGWRGLVLRLVLFVLPAAWVLGRVHLGDVFEHARRVGLVSLAGGIVLVLAATSVATWRWRTLLKAYGAGKVPAFVTLLHHNLVGCFYNLLPGGVGGDALRGYRLRNTVPTQAASYAVVIVERVCGLVGLLLVAAAAMFHSPELRQGPIMAAMNVGSLAALLGSFALLGLPLALGRSERLRRLVRRVPLLARVPEKLPAPPSPKGLIIAVALSVFTQLFSLLCIALMLHPLPFAVAVRLALAIGPVVILLSYIPVTPGALGQREALFAYFFGMAGVPEAAAVAASLLFFSTLIFQGILGGILVLVEGFRTARRGPNA